MVLLKTLNNDLVNIESLRGISVEDNQIKIYHGTEKTYLSIDFKNSNYTNEEINMILNLLYKRISEVDKYGGIIDLEEVFKQVG